MNEYRKKIEERDELIRKYGNLMDGDLKGVPFEDLRDLIHYYSKYYPDKMELEELEEVNDGLEKRMEKIKQSLGGNENE